MVESSSFPFSSSLPEATCSKIELEHKSHGVETEAERLYKFNFFMNRVFPGTPDQVVGLTRDILLGCAFYLRPALAAGEKMIIRGSGAKNFIRSSEIGPLLPLFFEDLEREVDPKTLFYNPEIEEAIYDGLEGQDLDIRFRFKEGCSSSDIFGVLCSILDIPGLTHLSKGIQYQWYVDGLYVYAIERKIPVLGEIRNSWQIKFRGADNGGKNWRAFLKLDIGELPKDIAINKDTRLGWAATFWDACILLRLLIDNDADEIWMRADRKAFDAFSSPERVLNTMSCEPVAMLRAMVNSVLWQGDLDDMNLSFASSDMKEVGKERRSEFLRYVLVLLSLYPVWTFDRLVDYKLINKLPLSKELSKRGITCDQLRDKMRCITPPLLVPHPDVGMLEKSGLMVLSRALLALEIIDEKTDLGVVLAMLTPYDLDTWQALSYGSKHFNLTKNKRCFGLSSKR